MSYEEIPSHRTPAISWQNTHLCKTFLQPRDFQTSPSNLPRPRLPKFLRVIHNHAMVIIIALPALVARLTNPAPITAYGLVLRAPAQTDQILGMLLAKELPALSAIDAPIDDAQRALAPGIKTQVVPIRLLPVVTGNVEIAVVGGLPSW